MHDTVKKLLNGVVISCQAYEDTPLYGSDYMAKMAISAELGGAVGVRACWPQDIAAIKAACNLPIVGINKKFGDGDPLDEIFITPTFESAVEIIDAGCDILALDCTIRETRPFVDLERLLRAIRNQYPSLPIMADLATLDEAIQVAATGCVDIISTTLSGYTHQSLNVSKTGPNLEIIKEIKEKVNLPLNAEGRIWDLHDLQAVLDAGADIVTIGTAVTRPQLITERFANFNSEYHKK